MKNLVNTALNVSNKQKRVLSESPTKGTSSKDKPINDQIFDLIANVGPNLMTRKNDRIVDVLHEFHDYLDELRSKYEAGKLSEKELAKAVFSVEPKLHEVRTV